MIDWRSFPAQAHKFMNQGGDISIMKLTVMHNVRVNIYK